MTEAEAEIFDLVQESILTRDLHGRITGWNTASERLYGWSRGDAIGRIVHELLQSDPDPVASPEAVRTGMHDWEGDLARITAGGGEVIVRIKQRVRKKLDGTSLEIVETGVDVTAQRRSEAALKLAEHRYHNVFRAMAVSFWELDFSALDLIVRSLRRSGVKDIGAHFARDREFVREMIRATRVLDVNDQSVLLFGRGDKQEMLSSLEPYWPDESIHTFAESVVAAYDGRSHYSSETRLRSLDGREFDTLFTACFPSEMVVRGKLLIGIIDISVGKRARIALEKSEQRYRGLFQFVPFALVLLDRTELAGVFQSLRTRGVSDLSRHIDTDPGFVEFAMNSIKVIEVNRRTVDLFAARDAEQLLGPVARLWSESPETFVRSMQARFNGGTRFEAEIKIRTFDDRVLNVLYVTDFPEALRSEPIGLACMVDITDRVRAQETLAQVQSEFAHAARVSMLGELTASIAHEVNQPLSAIVTSAEAALRWLGRTSPDVAELRALSTRTKADALRAAEIIRSIRGMAVRTEPEQTPVVLNDVVEDVMLFLRPELRRHQVEAVLELASGLPTIIADRVQLQQVVANLAINATQAMSVVDSSSRRLTVRTSSKDSRTLLTEVADTGPGIAAHNLDRLFQRFFSTKQEGMGIGLAICRSIIEAHGGSIGASNLPGGHGASFCFTLPASPLTA
jgi:PAS domain S-box-containing protein